MPRETVLEGVQELPPEDDDRDLRPQTMQDMVGRREVRERLRGPDEAGNTHPMLLPITVTGRE